MSWTDHFETPIRIEGGELVSLKDAADMLRLISVGVVHNDHLVRATELLIKAADSGNTGDRVAAAEQIERTLDARRRSMRATLSKHLRASRKARAKKVSKSLPPD